MLKIFSVTGFAAILVFACMTLLSPPAHASFGECTVRGQTAVMHGYGNTCGSALADLLTKLEAQVDCDGDIPCGYELVSPWGCQICKSSTCYAGYLIYRCTSF